MCGLAAILAGDGAPAPVDSGELTRIRDAMASRGPDGAASWLSSDGRIGLAHRRLSIIDLSTGGNQPMASADGRHVIVFNGEIYNYRELRAELESEGSEFRSGSDTEVVLAAYGRWGFEALGRLRGMFALALWDGQRQGLLLARDAFGIKPLYVADDGKTLRAASQVKALLAGGGIGRIPDPAGHAGFFLWGHVPEPHTLFKSVRALAPGSWLWAGADGNRTSGLFFDLSAELRAIQPIHPADGAERLRAALADSVRAHLIADVPVGVFLSSGLDSATLTALAAERAAERLQTVTLGFAELAGTSADEVPLAEQVAAHYGTRHTTRMIGGENFTELRQRLLADMDQPSVDGTNTWLVSRAARELGLKVALSGLGGDELFGGYDTFHRVPATLRRMRPLAAVPGLGRLLRILTAPWIHHLTSPKAAGMAELGGSMAGAYLLRRGLFMPWELSQVMDRDMAAAGLAGLAPLTTLSAGIQGLESQRLAVSGLELAFYMRNQLLRDSDWASMAHGLEIRVPLVDVDLFRAVLPLAAAPGGPGKREMAAAARPALPKAVLDRPKTGFFVPITKWFGEPNLRGWARRVHRAFGM